MIDQCPDLPPADSEWLVATKEFSSLVVVAALFLWSRVSVRELSKLPQILIMMTWT